MSVCNICDQLVTRVKPIGIELQSVLEKLENEPKNNSDHAAAEPPQWICNKCELKARNRYILKFQQESSSQILQMQLENEKLKNMINQLQQGGIKISILTGSQDIKDTADIKNAATGTSQKNSMLLGNIVSAMGAVITRDLQNSKSEHKLANSTQLNSENNNMMVEQACSSNTKSQLQLVTNENSLQQPSTTSSTKIICQSKYIITNPDPAIHELSKEQKSNEYILPTNYVPLPTDQENLQNIVEFKTEPDDSMEFLNDTKSLNALQNINSIVTVPEMHNTELDFATEDACNEFNSLSRLSNTESIQKLEAKDEVDDDELSDESLNKKQSSVEYKNFYRQAANMYYCLLCKKKFKYYGGVVYHINTYHLELKYKCNECSAIYTAYHDMRQHYEIQHKLKQIPLPKEMTIMMLPSSSKAGKTINNRHSFQALIRKSGKLYLCNKCSDSGESYTSKYYETVRRHVKACHVEACLEQQQEKENSAEINQRTAADRTARKRIRKRVRALWRKSGNLYLCNTCALNGRPYTCKHIETIRRHIKACHLEDDDEMELLQKQNTTSGPVSSSNITIKQEQQRTAAEFIAKDISAIKEENLLTECKFDEQQNSVLTEPEFIAEDISNATIAVDDIIKEENQLTEYSFDEQQYNMPTETEIEFEFSSMTASEQKQSCSSLLKQKTAATNENNDGDLTVQEAEQFSTEPSRRLLQLQSLLQKNILNKKRAASLSYHKFYRRGANSYYNCVLCKTSQNYSHRSGIIEHIKSMHLGVKYKCNECNEMYANLTGLRCHYKNKHKNKQIPLPKEITIMVLSSSSSLKTRKTISQKKYNLKKLIRKSGDDYVCSICAKDGTSYTRKYYESVRRHIKTCHRKAFLENELTAYRIDEQQNSVLTDNTIENVNELSLNKTQKSRSKRKKPINYSEFYRNVANNYYCVICKPSKKYSTCCGVIYHLKTVHFGVKYKCHECSVIYMAYHDIRQHYQRQHKTKPTPSPKQLTIIDMPCCSNKRNSSLLRKCGNLYICNECTLNGKYYTNKCYDTARDHLKACHLKAYLEQQQQINKLLQKQNATVSSSIAISQEQQHAAAELIAEDIMAATDVVNDLVKEENHLTEYRFDEQNMNVVTTVTADCNEFPPLTNDRSESERFEHYQDIQPVQESIIAAKSLHNRKQIKPSIYMSSYKKLKKKYICSMCSPDEVTIKYSFRSDIIKHMKAAHSKRLSVQKTNKAEAVQKSRKHAAKVAENDAAAVKIRKINKTKAAKNVKNNVAAVKLQMPDQNDNATKKFSFRSDIIKHMKAAHSKRLSVQKTNKAEAVQKSRKHAAKIAENNAAAVNIQKTNKTEAAETANNNVVAVKQQMPGGTDQNGNCNANAVKQMHKNAIKKMKNCRKQKVRKNTDKPLCADDAVLLSAYNTFKPESNDDIAKVQEISVFIKQEKQFNDGYEFPAELDKNVAGLHKNECSIVSSGSIIDQLSKSNQYFLQNSSSSERNVLQYTIIEDAEVQLTENAELLLTENAEVPLTKDVANLLTEDIKEFQFMTSLTVCAFTNSIFQDYVANYEEIDDGKYLCILCSGAGTNHFLYNKQNLLMHLKEKHFHDTTKSIKKNNAVLREQIALSIKRLGRKYICTLCPTNDEKQQFTSFEYEAVTRHVLYGHWQKHQCQHCDKIFSSKSNLKLQHEQKVPCTLENNYSQAIKDNQNFSVTLNYETATAENVSAISEGNKQLVNESSSSMLNAMISNRVIVSSKFVSEKGALLSDSTSHKCQGCARVFAKNGFLLRHQMTCKFPRKLSPSATGYRNEQAKNINSSTENNNMISAAKRQTLNSTEYNATQMDNWICSNLSEMPSPNQTEKEQFLNDSIDCTSSSSLLRIHNSTTFNSTNKCRYCCRVISRGLQRHENTCILALTDRQLMEKHITR